MKHRRGLLEFELDCFWWSICFLIEASIYKGQGHVHKFLSKWIFGNNTISLSIFAFHKTNQRYNVVATSLSDVALKLPYCWDGNVRRRCKNNVVATSRYDVSLWDIATMSFLQRRPTFPSQIYRNVRATLNSDIATTL